MPDDFKTIHSQVYYLLSEYPATRSNDGLLLMYWLRQFRGCESYAGLLRLAMDNQLRFETVRRARQRIQKQGWFVEGANHAKEEKVGQD